MEPELSEPDIKFNLVFILINATVFRTFGKKKPFDLIKFKILIQMAIEFLLSIQML